MPKPYLTVLMPIYNGERYLRSALESILAQTFTDFELLIIDDGSTDSSRAICDSYCDSRMRIVTNERNLGLIATLNRGLDLARGEFVARMDCDDISFPRRLERQIEFMERHPEVGISGTWYEIVSDHGRRTITRPTEDRILRFFLVFDNMFLHSSMILRKRFLDSNSLRYDPKFRYAEDYEFWVRCSEYTRIANLPEVLVLYRQHSENTSTRFRKEQRRTVGCVRRQQLQLLGMMLANDEVDLHNAIVDLAFYGDLSELGRAKLWLERLFAMGSREFGAPEKSIIPFLSRCWYGACAKSANKGWSVWRLFFSSPIGKMAEWEWKWKLLVRCVMRTKMVDSLQNTRA